MNNLYLLSGSAFVLTAACYLLFMASGPLEEVGGRIGRLLRLPEDVVASTFQAMATSGPEIVMAIIAATPFISSEVWSTLQLGEKACSGTLNMAFSAMDNLLGIGAVAMIFMIAMGKVKPNESIPLKPSTTVGLLYYVVASGCLSLFIMDSVLTEIEAWSLMGIGILFILSQFIVPQLLESKKGGGDTTIREGKSVGSLVQWSRELFVNLAIYAFLVFALIIFVRECLGATFNMALTGFFSVGGILIMFTSYVSSFPEFMLSYRYVIADKQGELLGMLFGSNVIDLAFAGFRSIWLREDMLVYTTGKFPELLPVYIWLLPAVATLLLVGLGTKLLKWKHAYCLVVFYCIYIVSGFVLL